jgi:DNA-binding Lrp family transcriptional regulator
MKQLSFENYGPGRPPKTETMTRMKKMLAEIEKEPGIPSAKLARKVGIESQECATLAKRLAVRGFILIETRDNALTYTINEAA